MLRAILAVQIHYLYEIVQVYCDWFMRLTFVIITRNRPQKIRNLVDSILKTELDSFSIVLIDDSDSENFLENRRFLQSLSVPFKHFSSIQAGENVQKTLEKIKLPEKERNFINTCTGLASPFNGYQLIFDSGLRFAPYAPARNLGIYCAAKFFNPEIILFLDDDCLLLYPKKLKSHLKLIGTKLGQKTIVAVSGLYKDIPVSKQKAEKILEKIVGVLRGMDSFLRKSFKVESDKRFAVMPPHMLGGALILSREVFCSIPFDPYVARGEDHAYALDLKKFLGEGKVAVRDNYFVVGHFKEEEPKKDNVNVLRDIFRFVYMRVKTGQAFIPFFTLRWLCLSLFRLFTNPLQCKNQLNELLTLLLLAPKFAKSNAYKYRANIKAWRKFLKIAIKNGH